MLLLPLLRRCGAVHTGLPDTSPAPGILPGPLGSNDANLRAMIVDPRDLTGGVGADGSEGNEAATPVRSLMTGRRPPLPASNAATRFDQRSRQLGHRPERQERMAVFKQQ